MERLQASHALPFRQFARKLSLILLSVALCLLPQAGSPREAFAETTGSSSPSTTIFYGTGETVAGEWQEDTLTIDGEPAYCVEVDTEFKSGVDVSACDPVARGIWSQEICTKLALIDQFVRSGSYVSTKGGNGDGHKVTDAHEQYAVAQCYIWKFLNDAGYSENHYGWFGASSQDGVDLTGSDTDAQIWDYVAANIDSYQGSAKYYDCNDSQDLACSFSLTPTKGYITLTKRSANEELSSNGSLYSLAGAEYGIFNAQDCSDESLVTTITSNDQGEGKSQAIPAGSYFVKELKASPGYGIDESCYPVLVTAGEETPVNSEEGCVLEEPGTGSISIQKQSSRPGISEGNDCYSLEGALYGVYSDEKCETLIAKAATDASGFAQADGIPLGTCFVREISAPAGFCVDGTVYRAVVEDGQTTPVNGGAVNDLPKYAIPEILIKKHDSQLPADSTASQGGASLENAEFEVGFYAGSFESAEEAEASGQPLRTWTFKSDADGKVPFDQAHLVSGDALFTASDGSSCIPLGTLVVKESMPPKGYVANDASHCIRISDDGKANEVVETFETLMIGNQVKRGDVEFVKISGSEENTLAGIPFRITSQATGETHVLVTDEEGKASTSSDFAPHSQDTNGNDWLLDENGESDGGDPVAPDDEAPSPSDEETEDPDSSDDAGKDDPSSSESETQPEQDAEVPPVTAPPIDDDDSTDTNDKGEEFDDSEWNLSFDDEAEGEAADDEPSENEKEEAGSEEPGEAEDDSEEDTERESEQDPESLNPTGVWFGAYGDGDEEIEPDDELGALPYGTYLIEELPCSGNEGLQLVNASVVISEDGQTVDLGFVDDPKANIGTSACDELDGDKTLASSSEACIVDTVSYANLIPGRTYKLTGKLVDAETGDPAKEADGQEVLGSVEFVPEEASGTAEVRFELATEGLEGSKLVVFETLSCDDRVLALHENIDDEDQSVSVAVPTIGTQAVGHDGKSQVISMGGRTSITDTVSYTALTPGCEYSITGTVMNALTGEEAKADGKPISSSVTFTPEQGSGSVNLTFEFDASLLDADEKLVVFERLFAQDRLIAVHEDPDDPGQTIELVAPSLQTSLTDRETGTQTASDGATIHLIDEVSYSNLTPGVEYELSGTLMDRESGDAACDEQGSPIQASCSFTPEKAQGTAQVEFEFRGSGLEGSTLVAFETLSLNGKTIAEHASIDSQAQSVRIEGPKVQTYASDAADQDQIVEGDSQATVIDTVSVSNATPGRSYTVIGILMDKSTGLPLLESSTGGTEGSATITNEELASFWNAILASAGLERSEDRNAAVKASEGSEGVSKERLQAALDEYPQISSRITLVRKEVTPETPSFATDMEFTFSTRGIAGETVVFEALIDTEEERVAATHADLDDQAQTIEIVTPKETPKASVSKAVSSATGKTYDKTGNILARYAWVLALLAATGCVSGAIAASRRKSLKRRRGIRC